MKKLCQEFWDSLNPAYACLNELVVLPEVGDCGIVEYFDYKAKRIIEEKKIFASFAEENKLMLEFPEPDCREAKVFERFFESPTVVAKNHNFEGLFAIDISNYIRHLDHDRFQSLITYIKSNPQTVFILFFYSDDEKEINRVHNAILHCIDIVKVVLPEPTKDQLLEYTVSRLENLCSALEEGISEFFCEFYGKNEVGYDVADYMIRQLKFSKFDGTLAMVKRAFENLDINTVTGETYTGIGF